MWQNYSIDIVKIGFFLGKSDFENGFYFEIWEMTNFSAWECLNIYLQGRTGIMKEIVEILE